MIPVNAPEWVLGHSGGEKFCWSEPGAGRVGAGKGAGTAVAEEAEGTGPFGKILMLTLIFGLTAGRASCPVAARRRRWSPRRGSRRGG